MIDSLYIYAMIISIVLLYVIGGISKILRNIFAIFLFFYSSLNLMFSYNHKLFIPLLDAMNLHLSFDYSGVGFFFAIINHIAFGVILFNVLHNMKNRNNNGFLFLLFFIFYLTNLLFFSTNLFTFFILWEFISILTFFIIGIDNKKLQSGLKYLFMNAVGGLMLLFSIGLIYHFVGSLSYDDIFVKYTMIPHDYAVLIIGLFAIAMLIKSAMIGFHTWVEDAYVNAQTNFTGYLSAILSKMGIFGLIILLFKVFPYTYIEQLFTIGNYKLFNIFFVSIGSITALIATIVAIKQQDIKKVLIYSSVGQVGYIIASFGFGYKLALLSVLTVTFVHFLVKTALFNNLAFIENKTETTDASQLGGLIKVMPFSFISTLITIIALAGIVPLFGFASKWIYYGNLFSSGYYIPLAISFLASTLAFLYCYKVLSTVYLGILSPKNEGIKYYASFFDYVMETINMIIPIVLVVLGFLPYMFFNYLLNLMKDMLPIENIVISNNFIESAIGYWNPLWIGSAVIIVFISMLIIFLLVFKKSKRVSQYDIAMSAEVVNVETPLHYSVNFYDGLMDVVKPVVERKSLNFYRSFYKIIIDIGDIFKRFYSNSLTSKNILILSFIFFLIILLWRNL